MVNSWPAYEKGLQYTVCVHMHACMCVEGILQVIYSVC